MNRAHRRAIQAPKPQPKPKPTTKPVVPRSTTTRPLRVTWASNAPFANTGYGVQTAQVVQRMHADGHAVSVACNYGLEGTMIDWDGIHLFPRGLSSYSDDVLEAYSMQWAAGDPDALRVVFTLYDVWVYLQNQSLKKIPRICSWVPVDHQPAPPEVSEWCRRDNVLPIAMSRFGQEMLQVDGIEAAYIPHAIERVFQPTHSVATPMGELSPRQLHGITDDAFVVMMNSANKGIAPCRKAFGQALLAFSIFALDKPDAVLYLHTETHGSMSGINLPDLAKASGIKPEQIRYVDQFAYRSGVPAETLAAFYTMADVCLQTSMGEGFGVPTVEAQACGTRVIVSDFAASRELVGPGWLVAGQPDWDPMQKSWFFTPFVGSIVDALNAAYEAPRGTNQDAIEFAEAYDADRVYAESWRPFLASLEAA